jgi:GAF domain-containing protein
MGITSTAAAPIVVDGELWGLMAGAMTDGEPLPDGVEERLAEFTELVATAISNTTSRERLAELADEQSALRRVATLVARESLASRTRRSSATRTTGPPRSSPTRAGDAAHGTSLPGGRLLERHWAAR